MQPQNEFLAQLSHDLRAPLTAILGYAEKIHAQADMINAKHASVIIDSGKRLLELIDDLVAYANGTYDHAKLQLKPCNLLYFLQSIANEVAPLAELNNNLFDSSFAANLPIIINLDSKHVYKILINLLTNACNFTQDGSIGFSVSYSQLSTTKGQLDFKVSDNGFGIKQENLNDLFKPFKRFSTNNPNSQGLGLAIAKYWADKMQAALSVTSEPATANPARKETIFWLSLPVDIAATTTKQPEESKLVANLYQQLQFFSVQERTELKQLISQHAISDLMRWCQKRTTNPKLTEPDTAIYALASNLELDQLKQLAVDGLTV